jgi:hypothetical protein
MLRPTVVLFVVLVACDKGSSSGPVPALPLSAMTPAPAPTPSETPAEARIRAILEGAKNDPPETPEPPLDTSPAGVAKVLAGIAEFQRLVQQRLALGRESNDGCMTKQEGRSTRVESIEKKMGGRRWLEARKTRYACCAPNLGQTIDAPVVGCLLSCTDDDSPHNGSEDDDWGGPGGLREECQHAVVALGDWSGDLKAGKL